MAMQDPLLIVNGSKGVTVLSVVGGVELFDGDARNRLPLYSFAIAGLPASQNTAVGVGRLYSVDPIFPDGDGSDGIGAGDVGPRAYDTNLTAEYLVVQ
jgi:hypothetical protein